MTKRTIDRSLIVCTAGLIAVLGLAVGTHVTEASCSMAECDEVICAFVGTIPDVGFNNCTEFTNKHVPQNLKSPGPLSGTPRDHATVTTQRKLGCNIDCQPGCSPGEELTVNEALCGSGCGAPTTIARRFCIGADGEGVVGSWNEAKPAF
jgi:hypothetical protein